MSFGLGKVQVLESKISIYEELSKDMLDKLERAVDKISENSNRVALVLERHEARLDEGERTNEAIIKLVEKVEEKIDKVEDRVNQLSKFRWVTIGIGTAAVVILKSSELFGNILMLPQKELTPAANRGSMDTVGKIVA
jgi:septation ring formation regulator EzrA